MKNILLIGVGRLGYRHLEAILKLDKDHYQIDVLDNFKESLIKSESAFVEAQHNSKVQKGKLFSKCPSGKTYDFVVIATLANSRLEVLKELLTKNKVENLLLEKVLFQSVEELVQAHDLLSNYQVHTVVNCPRRLVPLYQEVREKYFLNNSKPINFVLSGGEWGLGCNSIHFIDMFEWLSNSEINSIDATGIEKNIYPAKRSDFVEFFGTLKGRTNRGDTFSIECIKDQKPLSMQVTNGDFCIHFNEDENNIEVKVDDKIVEKRTFEFPYQSNLTNIVAQQMLSGQKCDLTDFSKSKNQHIHLLRALIPVYQMASGKNTNSCPIT